jgi:hypothetical protein
MDERLQTDKRNECKENQLTGCIFCGYLNGVFGDIQITC